MSGCWRRWARASARLAEQPTAAGCGVDNAQRGSHDQAGFVNQPPAEARWLTHAHREKGDASRGTLEVAAHALDTVGRAGTGACLPKGRWLALTLALAWLTLDARPELGALPPGWPAAVSQWGRASVLGRALALLDHLDDRPPACRPQRRRG